MRSMEARTATYNSSGLVILVLFHMVYNTNVLRNTDAVPTNRNAFEIDTSKHLKWATQFLHSVVLIVDTLYNFTNELYKS